MDKRIQEIINLFTEKLKEMHSLGLFNESYLNDTTYSRHGRRTHSRMLGLLAGIGYTLGYTVDIERTYNQKQDAPKGKEVISYQPDVSYVKENKPIIFLEYESLDQPFNALYKLPTMELYINTNEKDIPEIFFQIITLPKKSISELKSRQSWLTKEKFYKIEGKEVKLQNEVKIPYKNSKISFFDVYYTRSLNELKKIRKDALDKTTFCLCIFCEDKFFVFENSINGFKEEQAIELGLK